MAVNLVKEFTCDRDVISRRNEAGTKQGIGADNHLTVGSSGSGSTEYRHRTFLRFAHNWTGIKRVIKAEIVLKTDTDNTQHFSAGSKPYVQARQIIQSFTEGTNGEDAWGSDDYRWPDAYSVVDSNTYMPLGTDGKPQNNVTVYLDVTKSIKRYIPKTVLAPDGSAGEGRTNYGFMLKTVSELDNAQRICFFSRRDADTADRPKLRITYEPTNRAPSAPTLQTPSGDCTFGDQFTGIHSDPDGDPIAAREIIVYPAGGSTATWTLDANLRTAGSDEVQSGIFSVPLALATAALKSQTAYEWVARTMDPSGAWGPLSARRAFKIVSSAPSVVAGTYAPVETMAGVNLGGTYSDPDGNPLQQYQLQVQTESPPDDASWADPSAHIWDTGETNASQPEIDGNYISVPYAGGELMPGRYSFRLKAKDATSVWSAWAYGTFDLTQEYDPDPGSIELVTQVARNAPVRVALYRMDSTNPTVSMRRGPGALIGYLDDPINLGASAYLNGPGEVYFTLPALHPYCPEIEPMATHYAVEQYYGDRYRVLFSGVITDFDAVADEMVAYGTDYLGLLQLCVDARYDPAKADSPANGAGGGGSKYVDKTLDYIIKDQIAYHRITANSPVGFISVGPISALAERATIFSTYAEALPFIMGLVDSHKAGTGREARFYVRPKTTPKTYEFALVDNWGKDRPNIRLEYGGLLNDFRVVALGDFGTRVMAVGQKRGEYKVYRATGTSGLDEADWGRIVKTTFEADIIDQNDLQRRANEAAYVNAKIGKRMALAIRADMLSPFDGWDLGDNIAIDIERGVVDTSRYGSDGFWTIYGCEWRYFPDGHTDLNLTIMPKKTATAPDPDLIPSVNPGIAREWQTGYGVPVQYGEPPNTTPDPDPASRAASPNDWDFPWKFNTGTTPPPASGVFKSNSNVVGVPPTSIYIHEFDADNFDRSLEMSRSLKGGRLYIRNEGSSGYWLASLTDNPTDNGDYWTFPVIRESLGVPELPNNNDRCEITYLEAGDTQYFPPTDDPVVAKWYEDLNTGKVYELDESTGQYRLVLSPSSVGGTTPPVTDTTPPPVPIIKSVVSQATTDLDGTLITALSATVGYDTPPSSLDDLLQFSIQTTRNGRPDNPEEPDWTIATEWVTQSQDATGTLDTLCIQPRVLAATKYWIRALAIDTSGNRSSWSVYTVHITVEDTEAPPRPTGISVTPGFTSLGIRWDDIEATDISYVEVAWRVQPDGTWVTARIGGTLIVVTGLVNGTTYDVRVRSVDRSGNTLHDTGTVDLDGNPIYESVKASDPDKGWVEGFAGTPTNIPGDTLVWDEAIIENVFAGMINADWITAGTLTVGQGGAVAITVLDATGGLIGRWSTDGIEVFDPTNPQYKLVIAESSLIIWDLTDQANPIERVRLTPLGIDAASITFGSARGGHNLVQNSSFELGRFGVTQIISHTWDVAADWDATRVGSDLNVTTGATNLTMTSVT